MRIVIFTLFISIILSACSFKQPVISSSSAMFTMRSPLVRVTDFAFVVEEQNYTKVQVFNMGKVAFSLSIGEDICVETICYSKKEFNLLFFKNAYENDILEDIILSRPILGKHNYEEIDGGFRQYFSDKQIRYEVTNSTTTFRDGVVLIKIQRN